MVEFIVCCDCPGITQYSLDAYKIMAKTKEIPDVYHHHKAYALLDKLDKSSNVYFFTKSLLYGKKKFSYYIQANDEGDVVKQWNLLTASRIIDK